MRDKIVKMNIHELRKLRKKLERTWNDVWDEREQADTHLFKTEASLKKVRHLKGRVDYWIGKAKAQGCPAHEYQAKAGAICHVHSSYVWSMQNLYSNLCAQCKLTKKEAMFHATYNGIFNSSKGSV